MTTYRVVLIVRAQSVDEVEADLATTLGYSQIDPMLDSVNVEPEPEQTSPTPFTCPTCGSVRRDS